MHSYECRSIDLGKGGEPIRVIEAESDPAALRVACDLLDGAPIELWRDEDLVAKLSPFPTSPASDYLIVIKM
jgi:hypothetical protein